MDDKQKAGLDQLEKAGYLPLLRGMVNALAVPIWWYDPLATPPEPVRHNGTMCFVHTGSTLLGVTASHVFRAYLREKAENPGIECQIGQATFDPIRYLMSDSPTLDLATFVIPEFLVVASRGTIHHAPAWPPIAASQGEIVIIGGYPATLRSEEGIRADFPCVTFISRITNCSRDNISIYLNIASSYWPGGESLPTEPDLGGMSGGPVFRIRDGIIETLELTGFIYEASQSYELVFARNAFEIDAAGKILR